MWAIGVYALVGWLMLFGLDRLFPVWPVHLVAGIAGIVIGVLAFLASVAARPRR